MKPKDHQELQAKDLFNHSYLTVPGYETGRAANERPTLNWDRHDIVNASRRDDDDAIRPDTLKNITYYEQAVNLIDFMIVAPAQHFTPISYQYIMYAETPAGSGMTMTLRYDLQANHGTQYVCRISITDQYDNEENIKTLFKGKTFTRWLWEDYITGYCDYVSSLANFSFNEQPSSRYYAVIGRLSEEPGQFSTPDAQDFRNWRQYRWDNEYISYGLNEAGADRQWEEDRERLWFRNRLTRLEYPPKTPDTPLTDELLNSFTQTYKQYLWPHTASAYAEDENGTGFNLNEDVFRRWWISSSRAITENKIKVWLSSEFTEWTQYVSSFQEDRFKDSMDAEEYTTYETPSSTVSGHYYRLFYINDYHNNETITSYINYERYKWPENVDPLAKLRVRYTTHTNDDCKEDYYANNIPDIGEPAIRNSMSNGVHEVILTETAPSSNVWVALAKDNPSMPSAEVLSSFDAIPEFMLTFLSGYDYRDIPEVSAKFKPCRLVYDENPQHEVKIKSFFTNVDKVNYVTYSDHQWSDAYNNIIIKDGMLDRKNGLKERLLKTSSFNSFFSNSMYLAGISGANVGEDGKFMMNEYTGDYNTTNCRIVDDNLVKNEYEVIIAETEHVNARNPRDKFSHKDEFFSELSTLFNDIAFTCDEPNMEVGENQTFDTVYEPYGSVSALYNLSGAHIENAIKTYVIPAFRITYNAVETNSILSGVYNSDYALADLDKLVYNDDSVGLHLNQFKRTVKRWSNDSYVVNNKFNLFVYQHQMDNGTFKDFITFNAKTEHYYYHLSGIINAPDSNSYHIFGAALECYMRSDRTALERNHITSPTTGYIEPSNRPMYRIYQLNPYSNNVEDVMGEINHD